MEGLRRRESKEIPTNHCICAHAELAINIEFLRRGENQKREGVLARTRQRDPPKDQPFIPRTNATRTAAYESIRYRQHETDTKVKCTNSSKENTQYCNDCTRRQTTDSGYRMRAGHARHNPKNRSTCGRYNSGVGHLPDELHTTVYT